MMLMVVNEMKYKFRVCLEESLWSELNLLKICYVNEKFLYISLFLQTTVHLNMSNYSPPPLPHARARTHTHTIAKIFINFTSMSFKVCIFSFEGSFLSNNPLKQLVQHLYSGPLFNLMGNLYSDFSFILILPFYCDIRWPFQHRRRDQML